LLECCDFSKKAKHTAYTDLYSLGSKALNDFLGLVKTTPKYHYLYKRETCIDLNTISFAADIYERTIGYKELVGACYMALEKIFEFNLVRKVGQLETYISIVYALPYLSEMQKNMLVHILHYGSTIVSWSDALSELISKGIVRVVRNFLLQSVEIECIALILQIVLLYNAGFFCKP
ncbi:1078_t:CDS:2, partial [Dentiscutata erythropus]